MNSDARFVETNLYNENDSFHDRNHDLLPGEFHGLADTSFFSQVHSEPSQTSENWKKQLELVQISRQMKAPHFHAQLAAQSKRSVNALVNSGSQGNLSSILSPRKGHRLNELQYSESESLSNSNSEDSGNSESWTELDVSGIGVRSLSAQIVQYSFLTHLYLSHNNLIEVHPGIFNLVNLKHLDLSSNQITNVPGKLGFLTNLRTLLLFDNNISSIPFEFGNLFHLEMLGVEGNPLLPQYKQRLIELGTQGFISKLRDSAPLSMPPPPREWLRFNEFKEDENKKERIKVMNYNVLCAKMASPQMYGYTPSWALDWEYRKELILLDIQEHLADIICLQEVDVASFEGYFLPNLALKGYQGVHFPKSRAKTMSENERKFVDGCAIFYNKDKYICHEKHVIEFNQATPLKRRDLKPTHDMYNRVMTKDSISTVVCLENKELKLKLIVANAHIHWDPKFRDVKLMQVAMLLDELEVISRRYQGKPVTATSGRSSNDSAATPAVPLIICGDFNSEPDSGVYHFLNSGSIPSDHADFMSHEYGDYISKGKAHPFGLRSAYSVIEELPLTNFTPGFVGVLDYIWITAASLEVTGLLGEVFPSYIQNSVGFPDAHFPSEYAVPKFQFWNCLYTVPRIYFLRALVSLYTFDVVFFSRLPFSFLYSITRHSIRVSFY